MGALVCREDGIFGNSKHLLVEPSCEVNGEICKYPLRALVDIFGDLNRLSFWCKVFGNRIV